jgi:hypothetical protein
MVVALPLDQVEALSAFDLEIEDVLAEVGACRDVDGLLLNATG